MSSGKKDSAFREEKSESFVYRGKSATSTNTTSNQHRDRSRSPHQIGNLCDNEDDNNDDDDGNKSYSSHSDDNTSANETSPKKKVVRYSCYCKHNCEKFRDKSLLKDTGSLKSHKDHLCVKKELKMKGYVDVVLDIQ